MPLCGLLNTSFIIFTLLLHACVGGVSDVPPAPTLVQVNSSPVELQCRAPASHHGNLFRLFYLRDLVDSVQFETERPSAEFVLKNLPKDTNNFYCCQYDESMYSAYMSPETPPDRVKPPDSPQLLVTPSGGRVQPGQVLDFHCKATPTHAPVTFVLQRQSDQVGVLDGVQEVSRSDSPWFRVGPVDWSDGGVYTCMYRIQLAGGSQNSAPSSPVHISIAVELPTPRLSQGTEGELVCTGSPSYPGAQFFLFRQGSLSPIADHHAPMSLHSAQFGVPERPGEGGGGYQCLYSVLLGKDWTQSERSAPVSITVNTPPRKGSVDLALVVGSLSAGLLFLLLLVFLVVGLRKIAKATAQKKRQREQDQFWQQVHSRDHVIDLTLERISIAPKDLDLDRRRISVSEPIYDVPLTSFISPPPFH